jgi:hypothetical protein
MWNTRFYLACVGTCICDNFEKLNATLIDCAMDF